MKNILKLSLTVMAFGASALVVNASFANVPNTANDSSLTALISHEVFPIDNYDQIAPRSQRFCGNTCTTVSCSRSITAIVPEPATFLTGALLLLAPAMSAVRRLRRGKSDPAMS